MDYEAVKKKWDSWISENLTNLQRNFRNKSFSALNADYNGFRLKKKWINIIEDRDSQFYSWSRHFLQILTYLMHFNPFGTSNLYVNWEISPDTTKLWYPLF